MTAEYGDIQIDLPNVNYQKQPGRIQLSMTYVLWTGFSIFFHLEFDFGLKKDLKIGSSLFLKISYLLILRF